jgi:uncharacterized protein YbaR (Trm112 family)
MFISRRFLTDTGNGVPEMMLERARDCLSRPNFQVKQRMREDAPMASKGKELDSKQAPEPSRIDPRLLEILVCPRTKTTLEYDAQNQELISRAANLAYPIRDGIPILLPEEARPLD